MNMDATPTELPGISLVEELCLLAIEDDGSVASTAGEPAFGMGVVGACLVELSLRGRLDAEVVPGEGDSGPQTMLLVLSSTPTGEPALDDVLSTVSAGPRQSVVDWTRAIFPHAGGLVKQALDRLQHRGIIESKEARFLWVLKSRKYPVIEGRELQEAKLRISAVLLGDAIPSPSDSVLIGLASISGLLRGFLSASELRRLEDRILEVGSLDLVARGVERAIEEEVAFRARAMMVPHM
jgi:golgi phosphoprotein 3